MTEPTRYKIQRNYVIDSQVIQAFEDFCPSGERSSTVQELMKDLLERQGKMGVKQEDVLVEKQLTAQKAMSEYESLKQQLSDKDAVRRTFEEQRRVRIEMQNFHADLNEESKAQSRLEIMIEMGLDPLGSIPSEKYDAFVSRWKDHHKVVLARMMKDKGVL